MPDDVLTRSPQTTPEPAAGSQEAADTRDLAGFGYKQELKRILGFYSSFAVAFSYISPSTGIFTLYALGLGIGGPFFFWSWPLVALGQFIIALNFAEVSSHFPVAGSVYQWTKYLSNRHYSWFSGWIYLFAGILTVSAVDVTIPIVLIPLLNNLGINIPNNAQTQVAVGAVVLVSTTLLNIFGVRLVALVNNTGVVFEILGMVVFALILLLFFHHQDAGVVFNGHALVAGGANPYGTFFAAMFMSLFVIYGFDTASGQIPNPLVDIITSNLPGWAANIYLFVVFAAIYVCCLAIQTSTIRLAFGMARDGKLPFGRIYNKVSPTLHT